MGLGDWLSSVGNSVVKGIDDAGNAVGHAVGTAVGDGYTFITGDSAGGQRITNSIDSVSNAVFFDGAVAGTNPAQIYKWFHTGPGTGDYGTAENNCGTLHTNLAQYADHFAKANAAVQGGWTGPAGATALQNVSPSQTIAEALAQRAGAKQGAYGGQISVFDGTKSKLVNVPDNPPPPNNPLMSDPISAASDAVGAAAYQSGAKNNQQAYTAYLPPTQSHMATIPQGDTSINTGQSNDSSSTQQQGTGINQPGGYNPTFGHSSTGQQSNAGHRVAPPNAGPGDSGPGGGQSGTPSALPPTTPGGSSTNVAGYQGPPTGSGGATQGGYDSGFGQRGGSGGGSGGAGGGFGSVFAGGGFGGSGSGYGSAAGVASGGRAGALGSGSSAGAGAGAASEGMAGRAGAVAGARGAAGQAGAGGAGAAGRGGKREEDKEHKTAAYLINEDNGSEVVGDLPPSLPAGGVIGG
ncbi:hypothetical protein [Kutzneria buriramensis]|uniref:PPE family protein n=1 Tax=Kutzneria buriramensis TaxID=1045776 RepID=A0A3E0HPC8_9PSEU|nr:hypothetical protein [Kutzneria buriramensis]REH48288.1 hypothetical protein BCF44_105146 [Kutzneria buriramensis]